LKPPQRIEKQERWSLVFQLVVKVPSKQTLCREECIEWLSTTLVEPLKVERVETKRTMRNHIYILFR